MGDIILVSALTVAAWFGVMFFFDMQWKYTFDYDPKCGWHDWKYDSSVGSMTRWVCSKCGDDYISG